MTSPCAGNVDSPPDTMTQRKECCGRPARKPPVSGHSGTIQLSLDPEKGGFTELFQRSREPTLFLIPFYRWSSVDSEWLGDFRRAAEWRGRAGIPPPSPRCLPLGLASATTRKERNGNQARSREAERRRGGWACPALPLPPDVCLGGRRQHRPLSRFPIPAQRTGARAPTANTPLVPCPCRG